MEKPVNKLQQQFINRLRDLVPSSQGLVHEMSELLKISPDSAYRRLRGETSMTLDEVSLLCEHFKIPFDTTVSDGAGRVTFNYGLISDQEHLRRYLSSIRDDIKQVSRAKERKVFYAAIDIPLFHHFMYPEIAAFKMYYWMRAIVHSPDMQGKPFDVKEINPEYGITGREIYDIYCTIPSVEIWTSETVNSLVQQIQFAWDSGMFRTKNDALVVAQQGRAEIDALLAHTERSQKKDGVEFALYMSEIEIGNNCILVHVNENKAVYLTIHNINRMFTTNYRFCTETEQWINNLIKKATLVSGVSEKTRYQFFRTLYDKFDRLIAKIEQA